MSASRKRSDFIFLSTPSARRATLCGAYRQSVRHYFYPRPPRGGRQKQQRSDLGHQRISIHALREEGDAPFCSVAASSTKFLSTPSARRATRTSVSAPSLKSYFYPRPPRGGRLPSAPVRAFALLISIHALREEGDPEGGDLPRAQRGISIHALREEGDV